MPNSYHDAQGRFCSKGEMRAAIDNLANTATGPKDLDEYFKLRQEYELAAKEPYTPTPEKKEKKAKPKATFGPSEYTLRQQALRTKMEERATRQKGLNLEGTQVTEEELLTSTKNSRIREEVTQLQQAGIVVTKKDTEILDENLRSYYNTGYDDGVSQEMGDGSSTDVSARDASQAAINSTSFSEVIDEKAADRFEDMFSRSYIDGHSNGSWDS